MGQLGNLTANWVTHLFVKLEPRGETLGVLVLESKIPDLPQPDGLNDL